LRIQLVEQPFVEQPFQAAGRLDSLPHAGRLDSLPHAGRLESLPHE